MSSNVRVMKLSEKLGAIIEGVKLGPLAPETVDEINGALLAHKVLFFRGQHHLDSEGHQAFAASMGTPTKAHPGVKADGPVGLPIDSDEARANRWHTDVTFVDRIPKASILRAVELPSYGGSTAWASTVAAYEQLPTPLQELADRLWAAHTNEVDYGEVRHTSGQIRSPHFQTHHPVVRLHPETGERSLATWPVRLANSRHRT